MSGFVIFTCVCFVIVPKSLFVLPVIPIFANRPDSHVTTGTATVRNLVHTDVGVTVEEITTTAMPGASAVVELAALLTDRTRIEMANNAPDSRGTFPYSEK